MAGAVTSAAEFLSTPSARRATPASVGFAVAVFRFLSTPSARRATHNVDGAKRHRNISIHALREEGDSCILFEELLDLISIHALREEGDDLRHKGRARGSNFYPRPPRGGRRCGRGSASKWRNYFYPRPPRGGRPLTAAVAEATLNFYPRPPRGGRLQFAVIKSWGKIFLSTPSARRATGQKPQRAL